MDIPSQMQARASATHWLLVWLALVFAVLSTPTHAGTVTYVYTDAQGTPLAKADANGNIVATFDYAPYGAQALGTPPSGPGYTGHVNDPDTGLVYMQARYYDPAAGRFLSVDPIMPSPGNTFTFNRYDYTSNDPINHIDPDGRCSDADGSCGRMVQAFGNNPALTESMAPVRNVLVAGMVTASGGGIVVEAVTMMRTARMLDKVLTDSTSSTGPRPQGVPKSWAADKPSGGPGTMYRNPENPQHDTVRAVPGRPENSQPGQQVDHVVRTANGKRYGEANTPVPSKSQESHVPAEIFKFVPADKRPKN